MLGLKYGTVELTPYTEEWERAFLEERARLGEALSDMPCEIEHVGSTAVPGLCAKPILDIAIGVPTGASLEPVFPALERLGYEYRGDAGSAGGHVFVRGYSPLVRTYHLHLVSRDDPQWERYLLLRDFLRQNPEACKAYLDEKRALANRYPANRMAYTDGKDEIVRRLLDEGRCLRGQ